MGKARRKNQQEFDGNGFQKPQDNFGGGLLKGNPKTSRPLASKLPIHLTLRARKSVLRTPKVFGSVNKIIREVAAKHGVKIYKMANVGNHLHLAIKLSHVRRWAAFIREMTGRLALLCRHLDPGKGFWLYRPHTRIIRGWKKAFQIVKDYIDLNIWEAENFISRKDIKAFKDLRLIFGPE